MRRVTVSRLRKEWTGVLEENAGSEIPIFKGHVIVAYLRIPASKTKLPHRKGQKVKIPDFRARMKAIFGDRMLPADDLPWLDEMMKSRY